MWLRRLLLAPYFCVAQATLNFGSALDSIRTDFVETINKDEQSTRTYWLRWWRFRSSSVGVETHKSTFPAVFYTCSILQMCFFHFLPVRPHYVTWKRKNHAAVGPFLLLSRRIATSVVPPSSADDVFLRAVRTYGAWGFCITCCDVATSTWVYSEMVASPTRPQVLVIIFGDNYTKWKAPHIHNSVQSVWSGHGFWSVIFCTVHVLFRHQHLIGL